MTDDNGEPGVPSASSGQALARQAQARFSPSRSLRLRSVRDGREARRSTSLTDYFCVGAWFCGVSGGVAGVGVVCDFVCAGFTPENTDAGPVRRAA